MRLVPFAVAMLCLSLLGCSSPGETTPAPSSIEATRPQTAQEHAMTARQKIEQNREQYIRRIKPRLDAIDAEIKILREKATRAPGTAGQAIERRRAELERQVAEARRKLEIAQGASEEAWLDAQDDLNEAMEKLAQTFEDARTEGH